MCCFIRVVFPTPRGPTSPNIRSDQSISECVWRTKSTLVIASCSRMNSIKTLSIIRTIVFLFAAAKIRNNSDVHKKKCSYCKKLHKKMCILCRLVTMSWESVCFVFGSRIGSKIQRETLQNSVPNYFAAFRWRKERDSNPRTLAGQRFSRPPHSTALPSFLLKHTSLCA